MAGSNPYGWCGAVGRNGGMDDFRVEGSAEEDRPVALRRVRRELADLERLWKSGHADRRGIKLAISDWMMEEVLLMGTNTIVEQGVTIPANTYADWFRQEVEHLCALTTAKNQNYATADDAWQNFRLISHMSNGRISVADGLLTRMSDKFQRVVNLLGGAENNFESVADNLRDLAVYSIILKMYLEKK